MVGALKSTDTFHQTFSEILEKVKVKVTLKVPVVPYTRRSIVGEQSSAVWSAAPAASRHFVP